MQVLKFGGTSVANAENITKVVAIVKGSLKKDKTVVVANLATAAGTIVAAIAVYLIAKESHDFIPPLLALTSGFFLYVAASDIIPDIHEQSQKIGTIQAIMLVIGVVLVGGTIMLLGV